MSDGRQGSRSPMRDRDRPRDRQKPKGGIQWKERRPVNDEDDNNRRGGRVGGYRNRSPLRDRRPDRERDRHRDRDAGRPYDRDRGDGGDRGDRGRRNGDRDQRDAAGGGSASTAGSNPKKDKEGKKAAPAPAAPAGGEEMIIVNVNDRMGTKAAIPCFASDSVGAFKVMVAARIGRKAHEIMLRRQGERPFKDIITLGDYGVSNGVQLDLEVDTGD